LRTLALPWPGVRDEDLREAVGDYLVLRRSLGFKLKKHQRFKAELAQPMNLWNGYVKIGKHASGGRTYNYRSGRAT